MTSRILLRQQLMREQLQEQERREQQRQQASQYPQTSVAQTPAINVSVPASLPPAAQVPMEVLKVSSQGCSLWWLAGKREDGSMCDESELLQSMCKVSTPGIRRWMCHCSSLNVQGSCVFIGFIDVCVCMCVCGQSGNYGFTMTV